MQTLTLKHLKDRRIVATLNHRLAQMKHTLPVLPLAGIQMRMEHLHVGPGAYKVSRRVSAHEHPEIQLEVALYGRADFLVGDTPMCLTGGQALMILPEERHSWTVGRTMGMLGMMISISGPRRKNLLHELRDLPPEARLTSLPDRAGTVKQLLGQLALDSGGIWPVERCGALFLFWLCQLFESFSWLQGWRVEGAPVYAHEDRGMLAIDRAVRYMRQHYQQHILSEDVARAVGIGVRQLNRHFKEQSGESVSRALQRIRLNKSMELLCAHPEYSVKAVAFDCGFQSHSYFTRSFIAAFGVRPSEVQENEGH